MTTSMTSAQAEKHLEETREKLEDAKNNLDHQQFMLDELSKGYAHGTIHQHLVEAQVIKVKAAEEELQHHENNENRLLREVGYPPK